MTVFTVDYPSGTRLSFTGEFLRADEHWRSFQGNGPMPAIVPDDPHAPIVFLDPRSVVTKDGATLYAPRTVSLAEHTPTMRVWLVEHPEWAP